MPLDDPGPDGDPPLSERIADPEQDPAELERRLDVERAFTRLSEEHRVILTLRVEGDLAYAEIAETLGIPIGTVMSRLARAREALLTQLSQSEGAEAHEP
jgi:RNA polymerase sigma-70 factor (ECF subfamily)